MEIGNLNGATLYNSGTIETLAADSNYAALGLYSGSGALVNQAGAFIQVDASSHTEAQGVYIADGVSLDFTNAGTIDGGAGRGVDFAGTNAIVLGFENMGTITATDNGVEIGNIDGVTLYNRSGGIIETKDVSNGYNALFVGSGSGTIVNEAGAFIRADAGTSSESAIFAFEDANVTIENDGTLSGVWTVIAESKATIRNRNKILATSVTLGDAISVGGGGLINNQAGGEISAANDGVYIWDDADAAPLLEIYNAATATITGDSDGDGVGFAIASYDNGIEYIFNSGLIEGDVWLGGNDDRFANIDAGAFDGDIDGGDGRDIARMAALTADQSLIGDAIKDFEVLEKTGPRATKVTGSLIVEQARVFGGSLVIGTSASGGVSGTVGSLTLSDLTDSLVMGDGSDLTTTTLMVRGEGSSLDSDGVVGGDVLELTGDQGRQVIFNDGALIEANIDLGKGDDKVTNAFGTFGGSIDLGDGDDELEVFLQSPDAPGDEAFVGGRIAGSVDGGDGIDTIRYSLESGEVTLNASQVGDVGAANAPTGFERIAKGGAGNVIFDFTEVTIGDTKLSTNTFDIEGPTAFNTETTAAIVEGDETSGMIFLGQATVPDAELGYVEGVITNNSTLLAERGIALTGLTRIVNTADHSLTTHGSMGITGDDGAQTLANAGALAVLNDGTIALLGGEDYVETSDVISSDIALGADEDTLMIYSTGSVLGASAGGAGLDHLFIDTDNTAMRQIAAADFSGFEDVVLNRGAGATGMVEISGNGVFAADNGAYSDVVFEKGTLTGTGTVTGSLTVGIETGSDVAILAPGTSPGVLNISEDLTLTSNSILLMELWGAARSSNTDPLDPLNDLIIVDGDLTLNGALSIDEGAGNLDIADGNFYTLIQYAGALSGPGFQTDNLNSVTGNPGWAVDTLTIPGEVIILYADPAISTGPTIYWDGGDGPQTANNAVNGGNGVWDGDNTNWTTSTGDTNNNWTPGLGIFTTVGGTVEVNGTQTYQQLRFEVDGYELVDQVGNDGGLRMMGSGSSVFVTAGANTTIAVPISDPTGGPGLFTKSGDGRLLLTRANGYSGGTALLGGTLVLSNAAALGSGTLAMNDGTTLEAAADLTVGNTIQIGGPGADSVTINTSAFNLSLAGAVSGDGTDRLRKTGTGELTLIGSTQIGGLDIAQGHVTISGNVDLAADMTLAADTELSVAQGGSATSTAGVNGLSGVQSVNVFGQLSSNTDLGDDDDRFSLFATGVYTGAAEGGLGRDTLTIDAGPSTTRLITNADFGGFENVILNDDAGSTGAFEIAGNSVFAADAGGLSNVTLHRGTLTGSGGIAGSLSALADATVSPGNSIGTIRVDGNYTQAGVYGWDYRVPADQTTFIASPNGGNALAARNTVFGLGGAPLASDIAAQDADLISASGQAFLRDRADPSLIISALSPSSDLDAALEQTSNTAGEIRYLILRADAGGTGALSGLALGDIDIEYQNDAGAVIATQDTADPTTSGWTNAVLVVSGEGGLIPETPPVGFNGGTLSGSGSFTGRNGVLAPFSLRPEVINGGCASEDVLMLSETGETEGFCIWMNTSAARGSADLPGGLDEDLSEWEINLGAEARIDDETEGYDTRVGFILGWRETTLDYNTAARSDIDTLRLGAYADLRRGRTDLNFSAIWTQNDVTTQRFGVLDGAPISGSYDADTFTLNAQMTHWQELDVNWDLGWVLGASYATGDRDAYTETGSALESFHFLKESGNAMWATIGMAGRYRSHSPDGKQLGANSTPMDVNLFAGFDILVSGDPAFDTSGSYSGNSSTLLASSGASRWDDTALRLEADLTTQIGQGTTLSAGLSGRFTSSSDTFSAFVTLRRQW